MKLETASLNSLKRVRWSVVHKGEWKDYWFANSSDKPITIYIPENEPSNEKMYSFFHEIGHCLDHIKNKKFINEWENEVSAWKNSIDLMINKYKLDININDFSIYAIKCLSTYEDPKEKSLFNAEFEIHEILRDLKLSKIQIKTESLEY